MTETAHPHLTSSHPPGPTLPSSDASCSPVFTVAAGEVSQQQDLRHDIEEPTGGSPHLNLELLLNSCESSSNCDHVSAAETSREHENQLAMVRLGIASSLFYALRVRHAATAAHGLRVALVCSAWAERLGLEESSRDRIEVAALLRDIGKIGIPDRILRKPGKLSVDEQLIMEGCPELSREILSGSTNDGELLNIVLHANTWYQGRRLDDSPRGDALPLGARMLAIAGAFDAMTTDRVFRPACSRERALHELAINSGTQFDPELVIDYSRMLEEKPELLQGCVVHRWLHQLQDGSCESLWQQARGSTPNPGATKHEQWFQNEVCESLLDGVAFTDTDLTVTYWNEAMEQLTGIKSDAILGDTWGEEAVRLRDPHSSRGEEPCLVTECLRRDRVLTRKMQIEQPGKEPTPVHLRVAPVGGPHPGKFGTVIVMRDLSDQANLEQRLETLHEQATRDPLTGVANRAEFDSSLEKLVNVSRSGGPTFSLIICDIDHFKRVNDDHGHPAGDEALVQFASILSRQCRDEDLVARYGGEEFVMLAVDCTNANATQRAETVRQLIEKTPLESLGGAAVTASFGVTEFQTGDSEKTILARADRALLKAKDNGRNRVVQLGCGAHPEELSSTPKRGWRRWIGGFERQRQDDVLMLTPVPLELAIEKVRGFIADHNADIISVKENQVQLRVSSIGPGCGRRATDHQLSLHLAISLSEQIVGGAADGLGRRYRQTQVRAILNPIRNRDRRRRELQEHIKQVISSLRSYLMAEVVVGYAEAQDAVNANHSEAR